MQSQKIPDSIKVAIIQDTPVFLNFEATLNKTLSLAQDAADRGADIVAFPETWLPGYPVWLDVAPNVAVWDHPSHKALFSLLYENAVDFSQPWHTGLQKLADDTDTVLVLGLHERNGRSLYNSLMYITPGQPYTLHRKLIPTYSERLIWAQGDGSTLKGIQHRGVSIGGLICWEHWMPSLRMFMHDWGEHIHIAQWPYVKEMHQIASRHYAFEGSCYVLACGSTLSKKDMMDGIESHSSIKNLSEIMELIESVPGDEDEMLLKGGSCIIDPDGNFVVKPNLNSNFCGLFEINTENLWKKSLYLDTAGHYSRPDIFTLHADTNPKSNIMLKSSDED